MIIQKNDYFFKGKDIRFLPNKQDGLYIKYKLNKSNTNLAEVSKSVGVDRFLVNHVVYGRRRSRRVETAIAEILGHEDWNSVVTEARLVTSGFGTPTQTQIKKAKQEAFDKIAERSTNNRKRIFEKLSEIQTENKFNTPKAVVS